MANERTQKSKGKQSRTKKHSVNDELKNLVVNEAKAVVSAGKFIGSALSAYVNRTAPIPLATSVASAVGNAAEYFANRVAAANSAINLGKAVFGNHPQWYQDGPLSMLNSSGANFNRPIGLGFNQTGDEMDYPFVNGTIPLVITNWQLGDLTASKPFYDAVVEGFQEMRSALRSNLTYSVDTVRDALANVITAYICYIHKARSITNLRVTSAKVPELNELLRYQVNEVESSLVERVGITPADVAVSETVLPIISQKLGNMPVMRNVAEYFGWFFDQLFIDDNNASGQVYLNDCTNVYAYYGTTSRINVDPRQVTTEWLTEYVDWILSTYSVVFADMIRVDWGDQMVKVPVGVNLAAPTSASYDISYFNALINAYSPSGNVNVSKPMRVDALDRGQIVDPMEYTSMIMLIDVGDSLLGLTTVGLSALSQYAIGKAAGPVIQHLQGLNALGTVQNGSIVFSYVPNSKSGANAPIAFRTYPIQPTELKLNTSTVSSGGDDMEMNVHFDWNTDLDVSSYGDNAITALNIPSVLGTSDMVTVTPVTSYALHTDVLLQDFVINTDNTITVKEGVTVIAPIATMPSKAAVAMLVCTLKAETRPFIQNATGQMDVTFNVLNAQWVVLGVGASISGYGLTKTSLGTMTGAMLYKSITPQATIPNAVISEITGIPSGAHLGLEMLIDSPYETFAAGPTVANVGVAMGLVSFSSTVDSAKLVLTPSSQAPAQYVAMSAFNGGVSRIRADVTTTLSGSATQTSTATVQAFTGVIVQWARKQVDYSVPDIAKVFVTVNALTETGMTSERNEVTRALMKEVYNPTFVTPEDIQATQYAAWRSIYSFFSRSNGKKKENKKG